jgi:hypothetical protein
MQAGEAPPRLENAVVRAEWDLREGGAVTALVSKRR